MSQHTYIICINQRQEANYWNLQDFRLPPQRFNILFIIKYHVRKDAEELVLGIDTWISLPILLNIWRNNFITQMFQRENWYVFRFLSEDIKMNIFILETHWRAFWASFLIFALALKPHSSCSLCYTGEVQAEWELPADQIPQKINKTQPRVPRKHHNSSNKFNFANSNRIHAQVFYQEWLDPNI